MVPLIADEAAAVLGFDSRPCSGTGTSQHFALMSSICQFSRNVGMQSLVNTRQIDRILVHNGLSEPERRKRMNILDGLLGEHAAILTLFEHLEQGAARMGLAQLRGRGIAEGACVGVASRRC